MDTVVNLAVENCLISEVPNILTARKVDAMTVDELKELASESEETQMNRSRLLDEVRILKEGYRKCQKHKPRESTAQSRLFVSELAPPASSKYAIRLVKMETMANGIGAATPSRSVTPLGDPTPSPAAVTPEPPRGSSTRPIFSVNTTPTAATAGTGFFGNITSSTQPNVGSSTRGDGQAARANGTSATPAPPGTNLFANVPPGTSLFSAAATGTSLFSNPPPNTGLFANMSFKPADQSTPQPATPSLFGSTSASRTDNGKGNGNNNGSGRGNRLFNV